MARIPTNRRTVQDGDGYYGDTFEAQLKAFFGQPALVSRGRAIDLIVNNKRYECKTGAGELGNTGETAMKSISTVLYCPVFNPAADLYHQEAFVIKRKTFLEILHDVGLYRDGKVTTNTYRGKDDCTRQAIQTFWNHSKNAPHGKKYFALLDELYERCDMTLDEFLAENAQ